MPTEPFLLKHDGKLPCPSKCSDLKSSLVWSFAHFWRQPDPNWLQKFQYFSDHNQTNHTQLQPSLILIRGSASNFSHANWDYLICPKSGVWNWSAQKRGFTTNFQHTDQDPLFCTKQGICQVWVYSSMGSGQVWMKTDERWGQRFGKRLAWARVATDWIQWQGQQVLIPCVGSDQMEMDKEQE